VEAAATATATVAVEEKKERKWQDTLQVAAVSVTEAYKLLFNYTSCRETAMPRRCKHPLLKHLRNPTRHSNRNSVPLPLLLLLNQRRKSLLRAK